MAHLTLRSVQECITAAHTQYVTSTAGTITCHTTDNGAVTVQCVIVDTQFNCGFTGNQMNNADKDGLRTWCITHPGGGWSYGFRNTDPQHPDSVNVTLIHQTQLMFNFHVYLY